MIRWIKQRRAEEARMAEEEQRRLTVSSGQAYEVHSAKKSNKKMYAVERKPSKPGSTVILHTSLLAGGEGEVWRARGAGAGRGSDASGHLLVRWNSEHGTRVDDVITYRGERLYDERTEEIYA